MFGYIKEDDSRCYPLTRMDGEFRDMLMNITVHHIIKDEVKEFTFDKEEAAILLVNGHVIYDWEDMKEEANRKDFIKEGPYCLHISYGKSVKIKAIEDSEILIQSTTNDLAFESKFYKPSESSEMISGEGYFDNKARRTVRTIFDYKNASYSNLVMGEVISEQGGWSSFIPHHHPQPEVYYYRYQRPEGFGACFIGENAFKVTDKSYSCIPGGYTHPQVSAPGYPMYYCWMIRHLPEEPWTTRIDDERYLWLLADNT